MLSSRKVVNGLLTIDHKFETEKVSGKSCRNNQNIFPENCACYEIMRKNCGRAREVTDENITQQ
jgi:hypothetical protein